VKRAKKKVRGMLLSVTLSQRGMNRQEKVREGAGTRALLNSEAKKTEKKSPPQENRLENDREGVTSYSGRTNPGTRMRAKRELDLLLRGNEIVARKSKQLVSQRRGKRTSPR